MCLPSRPNDFLRAHGGAGLQEYQDLLNANNALDFDDLLTAHDAGDADHPQLLRELQDRFQYILIDEYQDTNHAQYVLATRWALRHTQHLRCGRSRSIDLRLAAGRTSKNILDFEKVLLRRRIVKLEQNYRSTKTILHIAGSLIAHNLQRKDKALWTKRQGEKAKLFQCQTKYDEANIVAAQMKEAHGRSSASAGTKMAIFYRMNRCRA